MRSVNCVIQACVCTHENLCVCVVISYQGISSVPWLKARCVSSVPWNSSSFINGSDDRSPSESDKSPTTNLKINRRRETGLKKTNNEYSESEYLDRAFAEQKKTSQHAFVIAHPRTTKLLPTSNATLAMLKMMTMHKLLAPLTRAVVILVVS